MALIQRYSSVDKVVLVSTGNTFMVCGNSSVPDVNTSDLIKIDGTTTRDWTQSGSTANLNIISNSTVLYAELVWYSTVFSNVSGALDLRSIQDSSITFTTSKGSYQITPQYIDSYTGASGTVDRYRAADVTTYVQAALAGNYTVSNVPISVPATGLSNSRGGWSLSVIYRNDLFKPQKVLYNSGISVATPSTPLQTTLTGFTTSSDTTLLKGSINIICANGQPLIGNEYVMAGPSFAQLSNIGNTVFSPNPNPGTVPNNAGNNFFAGLINIADPVNSSNGLLNINGTNGTHNNDGFVPMQAVGNRNKWDITNVDISNTLVTNQTIIAGQMTTSTDVDGIQLVALGTQVYSKAPNIIGTLDAYDIDGDGEYNVQVGEAQVYAIHIKNDGDVDANNVIVSATIDSTTTFVPGSVVINGVTNSTANILNGINIGTVSASAVVNILFTVKVNALPSGGLLYQNANYSYQFTSGLDIITNNCITNTIELIVQQGLLTITKSASKTTMNVNDTVTYTIDIKNTGTEIGKNLFFQDKMDSSCSVVAESVVIDGVAHTDYDPVTGFSLLDLAVGNSTEIVFQAKVNSLPASTKITNVSFISYGYVYNQYGYLREKTAISNPTNIQVQFVDVIGERCNNNYYPNIGDTVTYTLSLTNIGNISATGVQVLEPSVPGATFVSGSVIINGTSSSALNPFTGFILSNPINANQTTNIQYQVLVNSINPDSLIQNTAKIPFKYQITTGGTVINSEKDSNTVDTVTNYVCINAVKTVDKAYALINDILYYTVQITNYGNINATNTVFLDSLQSNISFVAGTVVINGITYPAYNPTVGFTLGSICPNDSIDVTFQVKVNTLPNPNIVYNAANLVYSYKPDPNGSVLTSTKFTNIVETTINQAQYTVVKSVDKIYAQTGDPVVYTTTIANTGTVNLTNIKFADYIGVFLNFVSGTVYINGVNYPTLNPSTQFPIDDLHPGDTTTIIFATTIVSNTPVGYIPNMSEVTLSYKENPDSPIITKTVYSNQVITYDPYAKIDLVKSVDKLYAAVGDTLTYSFTVTNNGNANALNTLFNDTIQAESSFVSGSVLLNGVSKPDYNPVTGFTLGTMNSGQVVTVQFQVTVNSLPSPNTIKNNATTSYSYYVDPTGQPINKTSTSNIVTTVINSYSATLTKSVDKMYSTIGDILNYTVTVNNTGTVTLTNATLTDLIPSGVTFVAGSVVIGGISNPSVNPNTGFSITDILPGGNVVITFKATVTSVPTPPQIKNTANLAFKYQMSPTSPYINGTLTSNTVTTNVNTMSVTNTKSVSKMYATVPDTLTYTSVIVNKGNVSITNTNFIDNVPNNLTFVTGSVKINGTAYSSYDPNVGFTLGSINAGANVIVTFDVTVDSVPSNGYVTNSSIINYQYNIDPTAPYISASVISNTVTTYINLGDLTIIKAADRSIVRLTNIITYNFVITNIGNTLLKNVLFEDILQAESSFNSGTVYVNGVNMPSYNPNTGFSLSDIPVGQQTTISFKVTANSIPANNELLNSGNVNYAYYVDPNGSLTTKTKTSNTTTVYVYDTIVSTNKSVDKAIAKIGDTLNFTITVSNEGNVSAQHVVFKDTLDSNISFITNSVYINGTQQTGYNPNTGFNLADIAAGTTTTVTFAAIIISRPANNIIYNYAAINYDYTVGTQIITANINTNTTQTYVAVGELTITKAVDKYYATVGDNLAYSVLITNTGSVNATNLTFQDLIPASASFNTGTIIVDGVAQSSYNPNTGFALTDLTPKQAHTVTFSIKALSLPQSGEIDNTADVTFTYKLTSTDSPVTITTPSNTVITYIKVGNLSATKTVDKAYATIGDILNYTVTINNLGNANCFNVFFQDMIQFDAGFVTGSVKINGVSYGSYNPNTGFNLDAIAGYGTTVVTFAVTVKTLPISNYIYNFATDSYSYYIDPTNQPVVVEGQTNTVNTRINVGSVTPTKSVSKAYATIGDLITYTVNVVNTGNTVASNVNFRDVIPTGLTFVTGSVTINGTSYASYNPYSSFTLGNINSGNTVVVVFQATVTSVPNPSLASNTANLTFSYRVNPSGSDIPVQINSNTVTTQINLGSLSLAKTVDKMYATMGDVLTYTVVVTNNGNINANSVIFTDNLQSDVTFNAGSVKVNGTTQPSYDPTIGFSLGNIAPLISVTVVFTVTVIQNPTHASVLNYAVGTFTYQVDPNGQYYSSSYQSNTVYTTIIQPSLTSTKTVDKAYATIQDVLNYGVLVKNTGNTTISQLLFTDFLSNGAAFLAGTVIIDGVSYPTYDPTAGFNLPNILVSGNTSLIQFQATVTTFPNPPQVTNYGVSNGIYYIDPQGPSYPITATSNTVTTNVNIGSLSNTKTVDNMYAKVNDTINYTSTITNTGNVNATNLFFTDIMQSGLMFVAGTVMINGVVYPSYDPTVGFSLSNLAPSQTVTVEFGAKIISLPTPAYVTNTSNINFSYQINPTGTIITKDQPSNAVNTNVVLGKITTTKVVDKSIATLGDDLTYTITLTNVGNVIDYNVIFQDIPSAGVTFKTGSVIVNGVNKPLFNPTAGFSLGNIPIGNVVTIQFVATVVSVPSTNQVTNQAVVNYQYPVDPKQPYYTDTSYSNTVTTNIAYGNLSVTKAVNKKFATIGEQLTYTITIVNTGNINATNVVFQDPNPRNTVFVIGSVTVNGIAYTNYNPAAEFDLGIMTPGQIITVVYKVQVIELC